MGWITTGTIAGAAQYGGGSALPPPVYPPPAFPAPPFVGAPSPSFMQQPAFAPVGAPRVRPAGLLFLGAFALIALAVASSREPVYC